MDRLDFLASLSEGYDSIIDIGSDHAYVPIYAVSKYGVKRAIAADVNSEPLKNAVNNISSFELNNKIKTILSDGLLNIDQKADMLYITGMGSKLIIKIISESISKVKEFQRIVLQANNQVPILRKYISEHGFKIIQEKIIESREKYYTILVVEKGLVKYTNLEKEYGPILLAHKSPLFISYYQKKIDVLLSNIDFVKDINERKALESRVNELQEMIKLKD